MAAGQRKANESFKQYRDRLAFEQDGIEIAVEGKMLFQASNVVMTSTGGGVSSFRQIGPGRTAVRNPHFPHEGPRYIEA